MTNLNKHELKAVIFSIEQDLDILSKSIKNSDADLDWKNQYTHLNSAYKKITGKTWPNNWETVGGEDE